MIASKEKLKSYTLQRLEKNKIFKTIQEHGELLFLTISGAHNYGFPSRNSDIDVRGVYINNSEDFLGINKKIKSTITFEESRNIKNYLDVSIDEVGHYLTLIADSNGNRLEWVNSNLIIYQSEEFEKFKVTTRYGISKELFRHYQHFARDLWKGNTNAGGVKRDLYTLRVYMTGILVLEKGIIIPDIHKLNEYFMIPTINELIVDKASDEKSNPKSYSREDLSQIVKNLDQRLIKSHKNSNLPELPAIEEINEYLLNLRISRIKGY